MTKTAAITLVLFFLLGGCSGENNQPDSSNLQTARALIEALSQAEYEVATGHFDSTMTANVSEAQLRQIWHSLTTQCGEFMKQGHTEIKVDGEWEVIYVRLAFSEIPYWGKVIFDQAGQVAGLRFVAELPPEEPVLADYVKPDSFIERGGQFGAPPWSLPAIISIPKGDGPFPAVILVHRHGPYDKNESIGSNYPFLDLAHGLASQGIAVLRYDKRSYAYKSIFDTLTSVTVQQETVQDVHYAVGLLMSSPEIDNARIFMLGHGFGGQLAPRVAEQTDSIAGYILMGAPARPLQQVIVDEVEYIFSDDGNISGSEQQTLDRLIAEAAMVTNPDLTEAVPAEYLPLRMPGSYWMDLRDYKPVELALKAHEPMLILQGDRDYHATMADFEDWRQLILARDNVKARSFMGLNHLFMRGDERSNPEEFLVRGNVDGEVIDYIAEWVHSISR